MTSLSTHGEYFKSFAAAERWAAKQPHMLPVSGSLEGAKYCGDCGKEPLTNKRAETCGKCQRKRKNQAQQKWRHAKPAVDKH